MLVSANMLSQVTNDTFQIEDIKITKSFTQNVKIYPKLRVKFEKLVHDSL